MIRRFGAIGDVHAEDGLLRAALSHLESAGVDALLCVGDIVDGRGDVDACCTLLAEHGVLSVRGNHERWMLGGVPSFGSASAKTSPFSRLLRCSSST
jgi:predicted phosphodiesterase